MMIHPVKHHRYGIVYLTASVLLFLIGIVFFVYREYQVHKTNFYERINEKLEVAAYMTDAVLTREFHDRAIDERAIGDEEYTQNIQRLNTLAKQLNVIYIYTMVERKGNIYFTASNATDEEIRTGVNLTRYYERYEEPSDTLKKVFRTGKPAYDEYADKWGEFRSYFLPMRSPGGHLYVIAADIRTDVIRNELTHEMAELFFRLLIAFSLGLPLLIWQFGRIHREKVHYLTNFDTLTQLPNKAQFENYCSYILKLAQRNATKLAVMYLNLDHFKSINDSLGYKTGDRILIETAKRLKMSVREADIVARYSADEFLVVISVNDAYGAEKVAKKILDTLGRPYNVDSGELNLTASVGIALYPLDGSDIDTLVKNAYTALNRAKADGRSRSRFVTEEMQNRSMRHLKLSNALYNALKNNEMYVFYQPQVSVQSGDVVGAEALLRWKHPEFGEISPSEFIPIAEETGLMLPIGEWVLRTAIAQARLWNTNACKPIVMAVNLSPAQFRHPKLVDTVMQILRETNLSPEYLELELTESMAMHDPESAIKIMETLDQCGIRMSIDDFGTGYSSLSYLKQFKIYKLKIDQSFIRDICTNADDKAIATAIISMAHRLGLKTIAEGVEKPEQLAYLQHEGCDEIQGYYYSKPCSVEEFEKFITMKMA